MRNILIAVCILISFKAFAQQTIQQKADSLHQIGKERLEENNYSKAYHFFAKEAETYYLDRQPEVAIQKVNSIIKSIPSEADTLFVTYNYLLRVSAGAYSLLDDPNMTEKSFMRVLNHCLLFECDSSYLAKAYRDAAQGKLNLRKREGLQYINKAIEINKAIGNIPQVIDSYLSVSIYLGMEELNEAAYYYLDHCENLFIQNDLEDYKLLSSIVKRKGINMGYQKKYKESFRLSSKSYRILIDNNLDGTDLVYTSANACLEAINLEAIDSAKYYGQLAIDHAKDYYPPNSLLFAHLYLTMGQVYQKMQVYDTANYYLDKCIRFYTDQIGINYHYLTVNYHKKAEMFQEQGQLEQAIYYFRKSLYTNHEIAEKMDSLSLETPSISSDYRSFDVEKYAKGRLSRLYYDMYKKNQEQRYLNASYAALLQADSLEWEFTNKRTMTLTDNIKQFTEYIPTMRQSAEIAYATQKMAYIEMSYQMLNNQKASYLDASLFAKRGSSEQQQAINANQKEIILAESAYQSLSKEDKKLRDSLLNRVCDLYLKQLSLKTNEYEEKKEGQALYDIASFNTASAIQIAKEQQTALIDYFYYEKELFVYVINSNGLHIEKVAIDDDFTKQIKDFLRAVKTADKEQKALGAKLSSYLLNPIMDKIENAKNWVIIPFDGLDEVPFDLLPVNTEGQYAVMKHAISYHYSGKLWLQSQAKPKPQQYQLLAVAPVFKKKADVKLEDYKTFASEDLSEKEIVYRGGKLKPLPHSLKEVHSITKIFNKNGFRSTSMLFSAANSKSFLDYAPQSNIIHIATHGTSSKKNPYKTGLFFYTENGEKNRGEFLSVYDIYNLNLNAHLVVLSACKTGSGQLARGEGVIALPRAFIHSGVPNVLASRWKIHDAKTEYLMKQFYAYLTKGVPYTESLQKAKIDCINKGYIALDWAGFFMIGA